ncbi:MAG TPA: hypothetical protein VFI90_09625 [Rubrobacter sp.]|nr:hypothetical protein [Rubrobacter sp.]
MTEGRLVVLFEWLPQRLLLLRGGEDAPLTSCGGLGIEVLALTAALDARRWMVEVVLRFERTCERENRLPRARRIRKDRGKNPGPPFE